MDTNIVSGMIGAGSGALVAFTLFLGQARHDRWRLAMELFAEMNSPTIMLARREAYRILLAKPDPELSFIRSSYNPDLTDEEMDTVWTVVLFFERVYLLADYKRIPLRSLVNNFGEVFFWWWDFSFLHLSKPEDETSLIRLVRLFDLLNRRSVAEGKQSDVVGWRASGQRDRSAAFDRPSSE